MKNLKSLLSELQSTHDPEEHLYRGQIRRYPCHQYMIGGQAAEIEALYPTDFRFFTEYEEPSEEAFERVTRARNSGRDRRDRFFTFLLENLSRSDNRQWAADLLGQFARAQVDGVPPANTAVYQYLWSLAQHYELSTALVDLTYSLEVAAWFASQPWHDSAEMPSPGSVGVIYRIYGTRLRRVLEVASMRVKFALKEEGAPITHVPDYFLVDIRTIPKSLARRPHGQSGASVYGFDNAWVISWALQIGAIEIFEFVHEDGESAGVTRSEIVPTEDPFLEVVRSFIASEPQHKSPSSL